MIFAAGLGTRLRPLTNDKPKALVELGGKTFLQRNIEYVKSFGFDEIVINIHHFGEEILKHLKKYKNFGVKIHISDERGELLETGGGLKKAAHFFDKDEDFLVFNVDILTDIDLNKMLVFHRKKKALATLAVRKRTSSRYLLFDEKMLLDGWTNTKTGEYIYASDRPAQLNRFAFSGVHFINSKIFEQLHQTGKFSIIKPYLELAQNNKILGYDHSHSVWMDLGTHEKLAKAEKLV